MSVVSALYSGISGITSNGDALAVAGDNIANISTPAFKSSSAIFESALVQQLGNSQIGLGSQLAATSANFSQGSLTATTKPTDLAINGGGFFVVKATSGQQFYTRAGSFDKDPTGNLITSGGGYALQGYSISQAGTVAGALSNVSLQGLTSAPSATTKIQYSLNLDAGSTTPAAFDGTSFTQAAATSNYSTTTTAFDSLGKQHTVSTYFRKEASNQWSYHVLTSGSDLANYTGVAGGSVVLDDGLMTFDTSGNLTAVSNASNYSTLDLNGSLVAGELINPALANPQGQIQWSNGAAPVSALTYDFGQIAGSSAKTTQYGSANSTQLLTVDGNSSGDLLSFTVNGDGHISGKFSNGVTRDIYKIPLAIFPDEEGLTRSGNNVYAESAASGPHQLSDALTGSAGKVQNSALEQSNTDLAGEFVKVITYQRGFQASSRTVQVAAELLQDLVQLGR